MSKKKAPHHVPMWDSSAGKFCHIPRLREMSKKPLARAGMRDSSGSYDSRRLSDLRGTAGPDRAGSGRDSRASSGPACERAGAAGPWDELRGCWSGAADRRRYDPDVAPAFRGRRGRWPGRLQVWGSRLPVDPGAAGDAEGVGRRHLAADDPERGSNTKFGVVSESRSGLIALVHRLGLEHRKPEAMSRKLDPARQQAFIDAYEGLLKTLPDDEAVMFADAVHPTHGARPVGCWAPKEVTVAVDQAGIA